MNKAGLYKKIVAVMNQVGQLVKDGTVTGNNGQKMYNYLSEEQTTAELQQAFIKHGLVLFPIKVEDELIYIESLRNGAIIRAPITRVLVTYKIVDADTGESEELQSIGYGSDTQDKGSNKAMTGAFKYVQRQTFMISTGDDGDKVASEVLDKQMTGNTPSKPTEQRQQQSKPDNTYVPSNDPQSAQGGITPKQVGLIKKLMLEKKVDMSLFTKKTDLEMLTAREASDAIGKLNDYKPDPFQGHGTPINISDSDLPF